MGDVKMDPEWKAKWVAALRGGKYKQGKLNLRSSNNRFCCWGVLCDVVAPDGWSATLERPPRRSAHTHALSRGHIGLPAQPLYDIVGLPDGYSPMRFAILNDDGVPFPEIADIIEREL